MRPARAPPSPRAPGAFQALPDPGSNFGDPLPVPPNTEAPSPGRPYPHLASPGRAARDRTTGPGPARCPAALPTPAASGRCGTHRALRPARPPPSPGARPPGPRPRHPLRSDPPRAHRPADKSLGDKSLADANAWPVIQRPGPAGGEGSRPAPSAPSRTPPAERPRRRGAVAGCWLAGRAGPGRKGAGRGRRARGRGPIDRGSRPL